MKGKDKEGESTRIKTFDSNEAPAFGRSAELVWPYWVNKTREKGKSEKEEGEAMASFLLFLSP